MKYYSFKNFKYQLTESAIPKRKCVEVAFLCNDQPATRFIFIKERSGLNYINEAKKIIKKEIDNGQLIKSVKKQLKAQGSGHNKPLLVTLTCVFMAISLGLAGLFTYNYFKGTGGGSLPAGTVVDVKPDITYPEGIKDLKVNIDKTTAKVGEDYNAIITLDRAVKNGSEEYYLPEKLKSVTSNGKELTLPKKQYTYTLDTKHESAEFSIPAKYVYGEVVIELELEKWSPTPPGPTETVTFIKGTLIGCDLLYKGESLKAKGKLVIKYQETLPFEIKFEQGYGELKAGAVKLTPTPTVVPTIEGNVLTITPDVGVEKYGIDAKADPLVDKGITVELGSISSNITIYSSDGKDVIESGSKVIPTPLEIQAKTYKFQLKKNSDYYLDECVVECQKHIEGIEEPLIIESECFYKDDSGDFASLTIKCDAFDQIDTFNIVKIDANKKGEQFLAKCSISGADDFYLEYFDKTPIEKGETPIYPIKTEGAEDCVMMQFNLKSTEKNANSNFYVGKRQVTININGEHEPLSLENYQVSKVNDKEYNIWVKSEWVNEGTSIAFKIAPMPLPDESSSYVLLSEKSQNAGVTIGGNCYYEIQEPDKTTQVTIPYDLKEEKNFIIDVVSGIIPQSVVISSGGTKTIVLNYKHIGPGQHIVIDFVFETSPTSYVTLDPYAANYVALWDDEKQKEALKTSLTIEGKAGGYFYVKALPGVVIDEESLLFSFVGSSLECELKLGEKIQEGIYKVEFIMPKTGWIHHTVHLHVEEKKVGAVNVNVTALTNCSATDIASGDSITLGTNWLTPSDEGYIEIECVSSDSKYVFIKSKSFVINPSLEYDFVPDSTSGGSKGTLTIYVADIDSFDLSIRAMDKPEGNTINTSIATGNYTAKYVDDLGISYNITNKPTPVTYYTNKPIFYIEFNNPTPQDPKYMFDCEAQLDDENQGLEIIGPNSWLLSREKGMEMSSIVLEPVIKEDEQIPVNFIIPDDLAVVTQDGTEVTAGSGTIPSDDVISSGTILFHYFVKTNAKSVGCIITDSSGREVAETTTQPLAEGSYNFKINFLGFKSVVTPVPPYTITFTTGK